MKQNKKIYLWIIATIVFICISLLIVRISINVMYPNKYSKYIEKYSKEYSVDKNLIYAIIKQESNFKSEVNSSKGAKGLMQLMDNTASAVASDLEYNEFNLFEPEMNINLGVKYLSYLLDKYDNEKIAIVAYNAGEGNVDKWIQSGIISSDGTDLENVPFKETNMYLRKVLKNYEIYNKLYKQ